MITAMEFGPNLLVVQKIAFFGENVYILYVPKMVRDLMFLLLV